MGQVCAGCCRRSHDGSLYEPLLQENEREAVAELLQFLESRSESVAFEGDALKALTTLSYSHNVDLQRSAALAFAEITERHVEEVDSNVLEPLLYLLREGTDVEVQRAASAALGNLAVNLANKLKIVRLGGLEPLMRQMQSGNVEVQCNAVGCITNLATHEENKSAIARSGCLLPLTKLAKTTKDIRVQRNATGALLNMTHSEENRRELVDANAIPVLIALLRSSDTDVIYYCTTALSNLAVDASNRKRMSNEAHLVSDLIDLMESPALKIQCQATLALRNLASDEYFQLEIARHPQGLPRLLRLLAEPDTSSPNNDNGRPNSQLVLAAVACIRNISIHPSNENKIMDTGFLSPLVALLESDNDEIQCHAISTLRNLAAGSGLNGPESSVDVDNKQKLVTSGALGKIQYLINDTVTKHASTGTWSLSWPVLSEMTACLAVLALSELLKPTLLSADVVKTLIPLTQPAVPSEVQGNAAAALGNLATKASSLDPFLREWDAVCTYLERFLEPIPTTSTHYHEMDEVAGTFQHIAVWTLLQFCEKDESMCERVTSRGHLVKLIQNVNGYSIDEEVLALSSRILGLLGLPTQQAK